MTRMLNFEIWNTNTCILWIGTIYGSPPDDKPLSGSRTGAHFGKLSYTVETPNAMCEDILKRYIDPIIVRIPRGEGGTYPGKRWGWTPTLSFQFKAHAGKKHLSSAPCPHEIWLSQNYCIVSSPPHLSSTIRVGLTLQGGVDFARVGLIFSEWGWFFQGRVEEVLLFTNTKLLMSWLWVSIKLSIG